MKPAEPQRRGRLGSKKSSSGCATCRTRKVKCDETRPACQRCNRTGRKCDGYPIIPVRRTAQNFDLPVSTVKYNSKYLSQYGDHDRTELQSFEYFVRRVLPGFPRVVDEDFWHKVVPQSSQSDLAVWHAVNALSSLIRDFDDQTEPLPPNVHALRWYNKSISGLQQEITCAMQSLTTCYITSILFICIECLQGKIGDALALYKRAMSLVGHIGTAAATKTATSPLESIVGNTIRNLLRHMTIALGIKVPRQLPDTAIDAPPITEFTDLTSGQNALYDMVSDVHEFICYTMEVRLVQEKNWIAPSELYQQKQSLESKLLNWRSAFENTFARLSSPPLYQQERYSVTLLALSLYTIWLGSSLSLYETAYDVFLPTFQSMIFHAENAIKSVPSESQPLFTFETRLIPCLFFIATKCRHPLIRRQALSLLRRGPKIENVVKAETMAKIAEIVIGIEESGSVQGHFKGEVPSNLALPPEADRVHSEKLVEMQDAKEQAVPFLRIGRWRYDSTFDTWSRIADVFMLEGSSFSVVLDNFVAQS